MHLGTDFAAKAIYLELFCSYYLVTKCVKGFGTALRTWGAVTDIFTAEEVAWYEHEYDEATCTDSTPVDNLPTSEEFDSYAVVEDASQILKDFLLRPENKITYLQGHTA